MINQALHDSRNQIRYFRIDEYIFQTIVVLCDTLRMDPFDELEIINENKIRWRMIESIVLRHLFD